MILTLPLWLEDGKKHVDIIPTVLYSTNRVRVMESLWNLPPRGLGLSLGLYPVETGVIVINLWGRKHVDDLIPRSAEVRITCNH